MATKKTKQDLFDFEKALLELEKIVKEMESGALSLEDSLKYFERGVQLTRQCQKTLANAEQKVQILVAEENLKKGENEELQDYACKNKQEGKEESENEEHE